MIIDILKANIHRIVPIARGLFGNVMLEVNSYIPPEIDLGAIEYLMKIMSHFVITGLTIYFTIKGYRKTKNSHDFNNTTNLKTNEVDGK